MRKSTKVKRKLIDTDKLEFLVAKTKVGNTLLRYFRSRKANNKTKYKSNGLNIFGPIRNFFFTRKNFFQRIILAGVIVGIIGIGFAFIRQYNSINFQPFLTDTQDNSTLGYFGPEYNVLLTGFKKVSNNNFAQMILLVSLNSQTGNMKVLSVNPLFITTSPISGKKYTLKTLINNTGSTDKMYAYSEQVETFLGVRIDRYIAFDINDLETLLSNWDFSMQSIDSFNSTVGFYEKGATLKKLALGDYLFNQDSQNSYDMLINRQLSFFTQFVEDNRSIITYLRAFWSADNLTKIFYTNMSKEEMSGFLSALMSSNLPAKTGLINTTLGAKSSTGSEEGFAPNYFEFDGAIKDVMLNIDIVREQANLEIYNASKTSGLASKIKRIFQDIGINVINTNNYPEKSSGIKLYVPNKDPEKFPSTINAIRSYFNDNIDIIIGNYKYNYTGDLILVLGE